MLIAEIIWGLLALNQIKDALRNRSRLTALPRLGAGDGEGPGELRVVTAPGVTLDARTLQGAYAHIRAQGLDALDLVPGQADLATACATEGTSPLKPTMLSLPSVSATELGIRRSNYSKIENCGRLHMKISKEVLRNEDLLCR